MPLSKADIEALLAKARHEEQLQLAQMLDIQIDIIRQYPVSTAADIVKQLYWKYQTPLGFITYDPTFDEICCDVAKNLKMEGLTKQPISCWELLQKLLFALFQELYDKVPPNERKQWMADVLKEECDSGKLDMAGMDWTKLSAGAMLKTIQQLGGFTIYKVTLMVVNQVAKVLIGRGLSLAANAVLVRALSFVLGPVGWALMAWGINDLFGTDFKRVVPATLFIYCIHERLEDEGQRSC